MRVDGAWGAYVTNMCVVVGTDSGVQGGGDGECMMNEEEKRKERRKKE